MTTLSQKYANKDTRDGIALNKTYLVPIEQLYIEPNFNVREVNQEHVEYWCNAWLSNASIPALDVTPTDNGVRVDDGQHRTLGALLANDRGAEITRIECRDFRGSEADLIAHMVNSSQGRPLEPLERANAYQRLKSFGWTNDEISKKIGRSVSDVQTHLALIDVPEQIKDRVKAGELSYASAVTVTREHGENAVNVINEAAEEAKKNGKDKITAKVLKPKKTKLANDLNSIRALQIIKNADFQIIDNRIVITLIDDEMSELQDIVQEMRTNEV